MAAAAALGSVVNEHDSFAQQSADGSPTPVDFQTSPLPISDGLISREGLDRISNQAAPPLWWNLPMNETAPNTPPPEYLSAATLGVQKSAERPVAPDEDPVVAVLGVGFVGIHLVTSFAQHYKVVAFDPSEKRLASVANELSSYASVRTTSDVRLISEATHILIAVPTSLSPDNRVDTSHMHEAIANIAFYAREGATIVIESSVAVGMTRSLLSRVMSVRHLKAGMSPERIDPGRVSPPLTSIPKIISGLDDITPGSLASIAELYSKVFSTLVQVSTPEVAEMTKLYENCQRMIGIAYANEMADACHHQGIDPYEVCSAAATKPFGYTPFLPGAGVGGTCIPVNPHYLLSTCNLPMLALATELTRERPARVADRIMNELFAGQHRKGRQRVLVVGLAFKRGQSVIANSPGAAIIKHLLGRWKTHCTFADPLVPKSAWRAVPRLDDETDWTKEVLDGFDMIIVAMKQVGLDFDVLKRLDPPKVKWFCP